MADGNRYLMVPEGSTAPEGLADDIQVIQRPVGDVYLVASDTMCLFDALGALDLISVSGIERDDWSVPAARAAMDDGRIAYGGKYRAPDYELLVDRGVRLSIQSTMINHTPQVRDKLMELGIPVLVELSSYEEEPLGRAEWIRLYGVMCDKDAQAQAVFDEQVAQVSAIDAADTGKSVAFFYLNANGSAVVRRPGDYVTTMIEQAGGRYAFDGLERAQAGSSSLTMEMEQFFATAKDADVIVYNATIDDGVRTLDELLSKNELLADFKAVRDGEVWVTDQDMYQQMIDTGGIIADFNRMLRGTEDSMTYLRRLS
jgi:iron complex transport system substrate-binding protein